MQINQSLLQRIAVKHPKKEYYIGVKRERQNIYVPVKKMIRIY